MGIVMPYAYQVTDKGGGAIPPAGYGAARFATPP